MNAGHEYGVTCSADPHFLQRKGLQASHMLPLLHNLDRNDTHQKAISSVVLIPRNKSPVPDDPLQVRRSRETGERHEDRVKSMTKTD